MRGVVAYPGHALHGRTVDVLRIVPSNIWRGVDLGPIAVVRGDVCEIGLPADRVRILAEAEAA